MLRFLKSKVFWLVFATVLILVVLGISTGGGRHFSDTGNGNIISTIISPVQKLFYLSGQKVKDSISFFTEMRNIRDENERLKLKVAELEVENRKVTELTEENGRLRNALGFKMQFSDFQQVAANIIAKDPGNWFYIFTIDKGTRDGVYVNATVATSNGLVGHVFDAGFNSSKVITVIDEDSAVSCRLTKTRDIVILRGDLTLKEEALCRLDYIPPDVDIMVGDMVETSGLGGIFPKGILVGKIKEIRQSGHDLNRYAIVEPTVDFKRLEEVFVLLDKNRK